MKGLQLSSGTTVHSNLEKLKKKLIYCFTVSPIQFVAKLHTTVKVKCTLVLPHVKERWLREARKGIHHSSWGQRPCKRFSMFVNDTEPQWTSSNNHSPKSSINKELFIYYIVLNGGFHDIICRYPLLLTWEERSLRQSATIEFSLTALQDGFHAPQRGAIWDS